MRDLFPRVKEILASVIGSEMPIHSITLNDELKDLRIDSFKFVQLLTLIEMEFSIEFDDNELIVNNFRKVEDLLSTIRRKSVK